MIIGVGTRNPAKIKAVELLLESEKIKAEIRSYQVATGVSAMPLSDSETRQGAMNRARSVLASDPEVTLAFGMEGGAARLGEDLFLCNWAACADRSGSVLTAAGARIPLPEPLVRGIESGRELGDIADAYANQRNVRSNGGTIGILTDGRVARSVMFFQILQLLIGMRSHRHRHPAKKNGLG